MIERIGIIFQGPNDKGFLAGLRDRLRCNSALVEARIRGKNRISVRRDAAKICDTFRRQNVDLIVRITDADRASWQATKREEKEHFPEKYHSIVVIGVTEPTVESWIARDRAYLEVEMGIPRSEHLDSGALVGRVKGAISERFGHVHYDEAVRMIVANAPPEAFQNWLLQDSFRDFYSDCRDAALREVDCDMLHDELRSDE